MQQEQETTQAVSDLHPRALAVLLANPTSGSFSKHPRLLEETQNFLRERGWQVDVHFTRSADEARQFAHTAVAQKAAMVIAVGGDGTIHSIIQELAGSETALVQATRKAFRV